MISNRLLMAIICFNCDVNQGSANYGLCVKSNPSPVYVLLTVPCAFYKTKKWFSEHSFNRTFDTDLMIGNSNFESQLSNFKSLGKTP